MLTINFWIFAHRWNVQNEKKTTNYNFLCPTSSLLKSCSDFAQVKFILRLFGERCRCSRLTIFSLVDNFTRWEILAWSRAGQSWLTERPLPPAASPVSNNLLNHSCFNLSPFRLNWSRLDWEVFNMVSKLSQATFTGSKLGPKLLTFCLFLTCENHLVLKTCLC